MEDVWGATPTGEDGTPTVAQLTSPRGRRKLSIAGATRILVPLSTHARRRPATVHDLQNLRELGAKNRDGEILALAGAAHRSGPILIGESRQQAFLRNLAELGTNLHKSEALGYDGCWSELMYMIKNTHKGFYYHLGRLLPMKTFAVRDKYGHGIAKYFSFCAFLTWLNLGTFIIWLAMVIVPWYVSHEAVEGAEFDWFTVFKDFVGANGIADPDAPPDRSFFYYSGYLPVMDGIEIRALYTMAVLVSLTGQFFYFFLKVANEMNTVRMVAYDPSRAIGQILYGYDVSLRDTHAVKRVLDGATHELHVLEGVVYRQERLNSLNNGDGNSRTWRYARRVVGVLSTLVFLCLTNFLVYLALKNRDDLNAKFPYLVTLIVSLLGAASPFVLREIVGFEQWMEPKSEQFQLCLRIYCVKFSHVVYLLYEVYGEARNNPTRCVEVELASMFLQLHVIDMFVGTVMYGIGSCILYGLASRLDRDGFEFLLADNFLEALYAQSLVWLGSVVCPPLPLLGFVTYIIRFYGKKLILFVCYVPPSYQTLLTGSQDVYFFDTLALGTLSACLIPISYFLQRTNEACGPHVNGTAIEGASVMMNDLGTFSQVISFVSQPWVLFFVILLLAMWVYVIKKKRKKEVFMQKLRTDQKEMEASALRLLIQKSTASVEGMQLAREASSPRHGAFKRMVSKIAAPPAPVPMVHMRSPASDGSVGSACGGRNPLMQAAAAPGGGSAHTTANNSPAQHAWGPSVATVPPLAAMMSSMARDHAAAAAAGGDGYQPKPNQLSRPSQPRVEVQSIPSSSAPSSPMQSRRGSVSTGLTTADDMPREGDGPEGALTPTRAGARVAVLTFPAADARGDSRGSRGDADPHSRSRNRDKDTVSTTPARSPPQSAGQTRPHPSQEAWGGSTGPKSVKNTAASISLAGLSR